MILSQRGIKQTPSGPPQIMVLEIPMFKSFFMYSKTCVKQPLKNRQNKELNDQWWLDKDRKYCRMLVAFCNTFDPH